MLTFSTKESFICIESIPRQNFNSIYIQFGGMTQRDHFYLHSHFVDLEIVTRVVFRRQMNVFVDHFDFQFWFSRTLLKLLRRLQKQRSVIYHFGGLFLIPYLNLYNLKTGKRQRIYYFLNVIKLLNVSKIVFK